MHTTNSANYNWLLTPACSERIMEMSGQEPWGQRCTCHGCHRGESDMQITCLLWTQCCTTQIILRGQDTQSPDARMYLPGELPCPRLSPPQGLPTSMDLLIAGYEAPALSYHLGSTPSKWPSQLRNSCWELRRHLLRLHYSSTSPMPAPAFLPSWEHSHYTFCMWTDSQFTRELNQRHYPWPSENPSYESYCWTV